MLEYFCMSKKVLYVLIICFISLLGSCSNSAVTDKLLNEESLKAVADSRRQGLQWTMELEKSKLTERITSIDYVKQVNRLTPQTLIAFEAERERKPIYPSLDNFGSLDISDIDPNALSVIGKFCKALKENSECEEYFEENSIYSLVLFSNDCKDWNFSSCRYYVGKGSVEGGALEVPVRFVNGKSFLDVSIYLKEIHQENKQPDYKILDVEIKSSDN